MWRKFKAEKNLVIAEKDYIIARIIAEKDCGIAERDLEIASLKVELAALKAQQQAPPPGEEAMADAAWSATTSSPSGIPEEVVEMD